MRLLALDPGAERMGWAVLTGGDGRSTEYVTSGVLATPRGDNEPYQAYRLRLISTLVNGINDLLDTYTLGMMVNETVPPPTATAFKSNGVQAQLAATAISTAQAMAAYHGIPVMQVSAVTVKKRIGGAKDATKVKVRNGVYQAFPQLKDVKWAEWVKVHDESDACAVGLTHLGFQLASS